MVNLTLVDIAQTVGITAVILFNVYEFRKVGKSIEGLGGSIEQHERMIEILERIGKHLS